MMATRRCRGSRRCCRHAATLLTVSSVQRATHAPTCRELVQVALHKPQSNAALGSQLMSRHRAGEIGAARSDTRQVDVVIEALSSDSPDGRAGVGRAQAGRPARRG